MVAHRPLGLPGQRGRRPDRVRGSPPALEVKDPALATLLDERFASLQDLLDEHKKGDGFVLYTDLDEGEVKELSDSVNALSEPLSQLTAAVVL